MKPYLTIDDAVEMLRPESERERASLKRELTRAIAAGALAYMNPTGKLVRIHTEDFDDYCRRHTIKAWSHEKAA